jgi:N,N'-diacetyllegionaminate synthase
MMEHRTISVGNRDVGDGAPCFVIAEAGINHNGDAKLAADLVDAAADAHADAIKFQTHLPEHEMLRAGPTAAYVGEGLFELLSHVQLSEDDHLKLRERATRRGVMFLSTAFCREAADFLHRIGVAAFKVGSGEMTNDPLLHYIARFGRPMIVSTGMSTDDEIARAVDVVTAHNLQLALMHCTSTYPTPYEDVHLRYLVALKQRYRIPVGISDHTPDEWVSVAAVALGANLVEKHFTVSRSLPGPDQAASIEPVELARLIEGIRKIERAMGSPRGRELRPGEGDVRKMAGHSVVSLRDLAPGAVISSDDVWVKRPGTGIPAGRLPEVIGRTVVRAILKDTLVRWEDLSERVP